MDAFIFISKMSHLVQILVRINRFRESYAFNKNFFKIVGFF